MAPSSSARHCVSRSDSTDRPSVPLVTIRDVLAALEVPERRTGVTSTPEPMTIDSLSTCTTVPIGYGAFLERLIQWTRSSRVE